MVMHSKPIVCWRDPRQLYRHEKRIRLSSRAEVISGNDIWSCLMHSNATVCWRGSLKGIVCGQHSKAIACQAISGDVI